MQNVPGLIIIIVKVQSYNSLVKKRQVNLQLKSTVDSQNPQIIFIIIIIILFYLYYFFYYFSLTLVMGFLFEYYIDIETYII